ncbi:uncharacterized protein LOC114252671 [Bombyx mandarina]|uniref:Uncharacterized protein LOC114252671 n=1 Tax=Bombyx mandarina TaxID=7092 RepID=A0A6J2KLP8_BOMMA|nr:uncharacterized protein LOC114252671 [Bombyx mandarina]
MDKIISNLILILMCGGLVMSYDEIDVEADTNIMLKILRDMANQTKADTLNLPANATSIRENITDTFSCENRTYGYYADIDNDCQVFHVCLPTQTPSGRAVTYRYSFICPSETVFNQEVLTCTRPRDAIECEDSVLYYDLNEEIGKVPNKTEEQPPVNAQQPTKTSSQQKETETLPATNQRRTPNKRKQSLIIESLMKEVVNDDLRQKLIEFAEQHTDDIPDSPEIPEELGLEEGAAVSDEEAEGRIALERRVGRKLDRGSFRFRADA